MSRHVRVSYLLVSSSQKVFSSRVM